MANQPSNNNNRLSGIRLFISLINNPQWFILSNALDTSIALDICVLNDFAGFEQFR